MRTDCYAGAAAGWAAGAARVYGPLAVALVRTAPHPLRGRAVLDAGAGTGLASTALMAAGARVVALDLSPDMLRWQRAARPPAVVGDLTRLPLRSGAVDDAVAAFVLNHLLDPASALRELRRVVRPRGAVLASVYATNSRSTVRDLVDEAAMAHGYVPPAWYREIKDVMVPRVGSVAAVRGAASAAGLDDAEVCERAVDVGIRTADQLVDYRFGQAQFASWLAGLGPAERASVRGAAIARVTPVMEPFRPTVLFLAARVP